MVAAGLRKSRCIRRWCGSTTVSESNLSRYSPNDGRMRSCAIWLILLQSVRKSAYLTKERDKQIHTSQACSFHRHVVFCGSDTFSRKHSISIDFHWKGRYYLVPRCPWNCIARARMTAQSPERILTVSFCFRLLRYSRVLRTNWNLVTLLVFGVSLNVLLSEFKPAMLANIWTLCEN